VGGEWLSSLKQKKEADLRQPRVRWPENSDGLFDAFDVGDNSLMVVFYHRLKRDLMTILYQKEIQLSQVVKAKRLKDKLERFII
jgi:hypothetical protein